MQDSTDLDTQIDGEVYSVSSLLRATRALLDLEFGTVWVEGEISNLARPASGHLYFTLKDDKAQVRCALFRAQRTRISVDPENGLLVKVRARVSLYEPRGDFQLIVDTLEPAGIGALQRAFEE
jgi:exodeoxyribonuclease VII large subunit